MKKDSFFQPKLLPVLTLSAGAAGCVLRFILLHTQMDARGLIPVPHLISIILYLLTAVVFAAILLGVLPLKSEPLHYRKLFPKSLYSAIGCILAGISTVICAVVQLPDRQDSLSLICLLWSVVTAIAFGFLAYARQKGTRPHYLLQAVITVYLMLHLVCQYRVWSPEPQLALYFFQLLACVFLLFAFYQAVRLEARKTDRRLYAAFNQAALFCCLLSLTDRLWFFYLGMGIYCATNLCSLRLFPSQPGQAVSDNSGEV